MRALGPQRGTANMSRHLCTTTIKAAQDVLFIPAVHTYSLSLHPHPVGISTPNMSSILPMNGHPISSRGCGKKIGPVPGYIAAQHAGTGFDSGWLGAVLFVR